MKPAPAIARVVVRNPRTTAFLAACALLTLSAQETETAYHNGRIITVDPTRPKAQAVLIRGNRFVQVGPDDEILKAASKAARRVDLEGRTVVPGIIESHVHPMPAAMSEKDTPIPVMNSVAEIQAFIRQEAAHLPAAQIIFVPKIYATRLKERRYPTREEIEAAAPGRSIMVDNGYASVLSSSLLERLGITRDTRQPGNGRILKDAKGEPTGLILGAPDMLGKLRVTRSGSHNDLVDALRRMQQRYNQVGITSIIDRSEGPAGFRAWQDLRGRNEQTLRAYVTFTIRAQGSPDEVRREIEAIPLRSGYGDDWLRVGSLKTIVDGGILIGTAYLREPYGENTAVYGYKDPDFRGVLTVPRENVIEMARTANRLGWQMTSHTTGGGAIDLLLDAYETADRDSSIREKRFTVTHGNFPNAQAIARAKKLGVVFDSQIAWHHFDGPALAPVFGPERMKDFLPLRSLIDAGVVVAGGSDHMIRLDSRKSLNPYHPFFGMWMAITRKTVAGTVLGPEQRVTREEALRMWTRNGAYLSFDEDVKGSITPGKFADMVVISKDYLTCAEDEIKDIEALLTIVDGRVVHDALRAPKQ